jgi:hypothetical protein
MIRNNNIFKRKPETRKERLLRLDKYFNERDYEGKKWEEVNGVDCIIYMFGPKTTIKNGYSWAQSGSAVIIPKYWGKVHIINNTNP